MNTHLHTTPALYEISDLVREYSRGSTAVRAVDGVDLTVRAGELLAIEGSSGSGKSTMLAMLGGLDRPSSGSIRFDGVELSSMNDRQLTDLRAREIGFIFQGFNLIPTLTAVQNVEAVMAPLALGAGAQRTRALELLERVGLAPRAHHLPSLLSGGEQQRVAVARALANNPRVVLADEPTGNLDSATATEVMGLLRALVADLGVTIVLVTHDRELAASAPRRIMMRDGRVLGQARKPALAAVPAAEPAAGRARPSLPSLRPALRPAWTSALRSARAATLVGRAAAVVATVGIGTAIVQSGSPALVGALPQAAPVQAESSQAADNADLPRSHATRLVAPAKDATVIKPSTPRRASTRVSAPTTTTINAVSSTHATKPTTSTPSTTKPKPPVSKPKPVPTPKPTTPSADPGGDTTGTDNGDGTTTTTNLPGWPFTTGTSGASAGSFADPTWWWPFSWTAAGQGTGQ